MRFFGPFHNFTVDDFPDAWLPLAEATRHPSAFLEDATTHGSQTGSTQDISLKERVSQQSSLSSNDLALTQLRTEIEADLRATGGTTVKDRKEALVNKALQDIGMGRYQWCLFVKVGFGWFSDNLWLQGLALTLPELGKEFGMAETKVRFTSLGFMAALCLGALFWGILSDVLGRRFVFKSTLLVCGVFGILIGFMPIWPAVLMMYCVVAFGVGGSLPVDGALLLEFLPRTSGQLLTLLSVWWPLGSAMGSLFAWGLIPNYTASHKGWRYLNHAMGGLTLVLGVIRFFAPVIESPKFLLTKGHDAEAVAAMRAIAYFNKRKTWLSVELLVEVAGKEAVVGEQQLSTADIIRKSAKKFSKQSIASLFSNNERKLNTSLLWSIWALVGLAYPLYNSFLPQYLARIGPSEILKPVSQLYRESLIIAVVGIPGSAIACWAVDLKILGRKYTMAIGTVLTALFLLLIPLVMTTNSTAQLYFNCVVSFSQNVMYGVLYAYSPETFPASSRGTGSGIASFLNRCMGLIAPIVAIYGVSNDPRTPIILAGVLCLVATGAMLFLPIETRGRRQS